MGSGVGAEDAAVGGDAAGGGGGVVAERAGDEGLGRAHEARGHDVGRPLLVGAGVGVLRVEQAQVVHQRAGTDDEVVARDDQLVALRRAHDGGQLGPLGRLADGGGVAPRQQLGGLVEVRIGRQHVARVEPDEPRDGLGIRGPDADDGVEAAGPKHRRLDPVDVVGGQDDHEFEPLGVRAVHQVEQLVHLFRTLDVAQDLIEVLGEDDRRLVDLREPNGPRQVRHVLEVDERPPRVDRLARRHGGEERLAGPVWAFEQDAALQRHAALAALLRPLDGREERGLHLVHHDLREDEVALLDGGLEEGGSDRGVEVLLVIGEDRPDGLPVIDGFLAEDAPGLVHDLADVLQVLLLDRAAQAEAPQALLEDGARGQFAFDSRDDHVTPGHLREGVDAGLELDHHRRARPEERRRGDLGHEAVDVHQRPREGVRAVEGEGGHGLHDRDRLLLVLLDRGQPLTGRPVRHVLGDDDGLAAPFHRDILEFLNRLLLFGHNGSFSHAESIFRYYIIPTDRTNLQPSEQSLWGLLGRV